MRVYPNRPNLLDRPNTVLSKELILEGLDDVDDMDDDLHNLILDNQSDY